MSRIQNEKSDVKHEIIDRYQAGRRIDNYLVTQLQDVPKSRIYQMLRRGEVRINGGRVRQTYRLQEGDRVRIPPVRELPAAEIASPPKPLLQRLSANIVYEDDRIIALNKPAGLPVHGGSGHSYGIIEVMRTIRSGEQELQLVHRLDQDTSGCLLLAKDPITLRELHDALKQGAVEKQYLTLLKGSLNEPSIRVTQSLKKSQLRSGERMVAVNDDLGKSAYSRFNTIKSYANATLTEVFIGTGRTHQIRVHAEHIGHPVAGDRKYGDKEFNRLMRSFGLKRMFLHASRLRLPYPGSKRSLEIVAPLPEELEEVLGHLAATKSPE